MEAVDKIDWDRINLDEWTALLVSTGNAKTADGIDIVTLTGTASRLNWTGKMGNASDRGMPDHSDERTVVKQESRTDRRNVIERTEEKLNGHDIDGLRDEGEKCLTLQLGNGLTVRGGCAMGALPSP